MSYEKLTRNIFIYMFDIFVTVIFVTIIFFTYKTTYQFGSETIPVGPLFVFLLGMVYSKLPSIEMFLTKDNKDG